MLTPQQQQLWDEYLQHESRSCRAEKVEALQAFVNELLRAPAMSWHVWARSLAERVVDQKDPMLLRRPLFDNVVFPALLAGHREKVAGCTRWLAGLFTQVAQSLACRAKLHDDEQSQWQLWRTAIAIDPSDDRSRLALIEWLANQFDFSLHEVPSGVLYGHDGATPNQCLLLLDELALFEEQIAIAGLTGKYGELVEECKYHFEAYRAFLQSRDCYVTYQAYIDAHPPPGDDPH